MYVRTRGAPPACDLSSSQRRGGRDILEAAAATDPGHVRSRNEDAHLHDPERRLLAVADGLGGHVGGDVASRTALREIDEVLTAERLRGGDPSELLPEALRAANHRVRARVDEEPSLRGMGTTVVLAHLDATGGGLTVAHVGDSRAYTLSGGRLRRLTEDHVHRGLLGRTLIQAVGTQPHVEPDLVRVSPEAGDRLLLCTDGLTDMLTEEQIAELLARGGDDATACGALVDAALDQGGVDNVTVVVATITGKAALSPTEARAR